MPNRRIEDQIAALQHAAQDGPTPAVEAALRKALTDRVGLVVAKAAKIAAGLQMRDLFPDLLRAYDRLFEKPLDRDPQCWGKNAIAKALVEMDYRDSPPFERGANHVQIEPAFVRPEDTAPQLRAICVLARSSLNAPMGAAPCRSSSSTASRLAATRSLPPWFARAN